MLLSLPSVPPKGNDRSGLLVKIEQRTTSAICTRRLGVISGKKVLRKRKAIVNFQLLIKLSALVLGIWAVYRGVRDWRYFVRQHPPIEYRPAANAERWRWSNPPPEIALRMEDALEHSRLLLPDVRSVINVVGSLFGCAFALGGLAILINLFFLAPPSDRFLGPIFVSVFLIVCGRLMLDLDSRLVAIDLKHDCVIFVVRYGVFLFHRISFDRGSVKSFSGKVQSALAMERGQREPHYYVFVKRTFSNKRYITLCDPSQGSWLTGGLEYWKNG